MRSWRRLSSMSISDHASWVRLRLLTRPLNAAQTAEDEEDDDDDDDDQCDHVGSDLPRALLMEQ